MKEQGTQGGAEIQTSHWTKLVFGDAVIKGRGRGIFLPVRGVKIWGWQRHGPLLLSGKGDRKGGMDPLIPGNL